MNAQERGRKVIEAINDGNVDAAFEILKDKGEVAFSNVIKGDNAIHMAARKGLLDVVKAMKDKGADIQQQNQNGNTPVHYASREGYVELVQYLQEQGANINIYNQAGETPLHWASTKQTMDVIEKLVNLGMKPNLENKDNHETALHVSLKCGRQEAMEGLLIKGARPSLKDKTGKTAEDVGKTEEIREQLRMYGAMMAAMMSGCIKAIGTTLTQDSVSKPRKLDRVGVIIQSLDIPKGSRVAFYCRREKSENSTVQLIDEEEESIFSDIFHFRISDVARDCYTKISLPLYMAPSEKDQMVLRFVNPSLDDVLLDDFEIMDDITYCTLETVLIPQTTCICLVYVVPRREDNTVHDSSTIVKSKMEEDFKLEIQEGSFPEETIVSLKVFETNADDCVNELDIAHTSDRPDSDENEENGGAESNANQLANNTLITDIYQINISGQQPEKGVTVQIPLCKGAEKIEDVAIVTADEDCLHEEGALQVVPAKPKIVNQLLIFEVSHFCIYVATPKDKIATAEDMDTTRLNIINARERQKPGTLYALIKHVDGLKHTLIVECGIASKTKGRREKWVKDGFEVQTPHETEPMMMSPGDEFYVDVKGNAHFEKQSDEQRKICFSLCRFSQQFYSIELDKKATKASDAFGDVLITMKKGNVKEQVACLSVALHTPPPPTKAAMKRYGKPSPYETIKTFYDAAKSDGRPDSKADGRPISKAEAHRGSKSAASRTPTRRVKTGSKSKKK